MLISQSDIQRQNERLGMGDSDGEPFTFYQSLRAWRESEDGVFFRSCIKVVDKPKEKAVEVEAPSLYEQFFGPQADEPQQKTGAALQASYGNTSQTHGSRARFGLSKRTRSRHDFDASHESHPDDHTCAARGLWQCHFGCVRVGIFECCRVAV